MVRNENTTLEELVKGEWSLVRSRFELEPNSEDVTKPSHYLIKREDETVAIMLVYTTAETKLETVNDWYQVSYPDTVHIHNDIFSFDKNLAKYSLDSLTVQELVDDVIEKKGSLVNRLVYKRRVAKAIYPFFSEVEKLVFEKALSEEEVLKAYEVALKETA